VAASLRSKGNTVGPSLANVRSGRRESRSLHKDHSKRIRVVHRTRVC